MPTEKQAFAKKFIKEQEGLRLDSYFCAKREISIGYGTKSYRGEKISKSTAERRFNKYLEENVWSVVPDSLSYNQYTVYASLEYNLGHRRAAKVLIKNKDGSYKLDCKKILSFNKVDGKKHKGIINRRKREYELCIAKSYAF